MCRRSERNRKTFVLGWLALPATDFEKYALSNRTQKIRGAKCDQMVLKDAPKNDVPGSGFSLWCHSQRDFLPARDTHRYTFHHYELDHEYRVDGSGRVVPSGLQFIDRNSKDAISGTAKC